MRVRWYKKLQVKFIMTLNRVFKKLGIPPIVFVQDPNKEDQTPAITVVLYRIKMSGMGRQEVFSAFHRLGNLPSNEEDLKSYFPDTYKIVSEVFDNVPNRYHILNQDLVKNHMKYGFIAMQLREELLK